MSRRTVLPFLTEMILILATAVLAVMFTSPAGHAHVHIRAVAFRVTSAGSAPQVSVLAQIRMERCDGDRDDTGCGVMVAHFSGRASYRVRPGDTLSGIAARYGTTWEHLWALNRGLIADPNSIMVGWVIHVSGRAPAVASVSVTSAPVSHGVYSYAGLEALWRSAGGSASRAAVAACIAEHESGGRPWAISPTDDWGLWQIHAGGYAVLNPFTNAQRAVAMSRNGTDWSQWTTHSYCGV